MFEVVDLFPTDYHELLTIWEDSVRATHDFITEQDIEFFKPIIIEQAFPTVALKGFKVVSRSPTDDMGKPFPILHMHM